MDQDEVQAVKISKARVLFAQYEKSFWDAPTRDLLPEERFRKIVGPRVIEGLDIDLLWREWRHLVDIANGNPDITFVDVFATRIE